MNKEINSKTVIPYYKDADFFKNVKTSSQNRKQNKIFFILKKMLNYTYAMLAYTCPINNIRVYLHRLRGVNIGKNVFIGLRCTLDHAYPNFIYLHNNVILSGDVYIVAHNKPSVNFKRKISSYVAPVIIKDNSFIGVRSVILPGVEIGSGCFIAGGSVVSKNVGDNHVVGGNPAEVLHTLG